MLVELGYKYRWYPTKEQEAILAKTFGCVRFSYNWLLGLRSNYYNKFGKNISYEEASYWFTLVKKLPEFNWLKETAAVPLQQSLRHCDTSFKKFFKGLSDYPCFKKKNSDQKATYMNNAFKFDSQNRKLYITGLGNISNIKWHRTFVGKVSSITITKSRTNKYYLSFTTTEDKSPLPKTGQTVGIDLGLKDLMILSDGTKVENPRFLRKALKRLKHLQRELARKQKEVIGESVSGLSWLKLMKK
jgi:putative transposase